MLFALTDNLEIKQFRAHKYWRQVNLDVDRSHRRFPAGGAIMLIFPVAKQTNIFKGFKQNLFISHAVIARLSVNTVCTYISTYRKKVMSDTELVLFMIINCCKARVSYNYVSLG